MQAKSWLLAALLAAGLPFAAQAQSSGYYLGVGVGADFQSDADLSGSGINTSLDTDPGPAGSLTLGYKYGNHFRTEIEGTYRNVDGDSVSGTGAGGDVGAWSAMINGLYDFDTGSSFTPYLGLGAGVVRVDYDGISPVGGSRIDDADTLLAAQGIAGVAYAIRDNLDLTVDYRYLLAQDPEFRTDAGTGVDSEFQEQRIMIGLRFTFGGPKPMPKAEPVPAAAPAPAPKPAPMVEKTPEPAPPPVARTYLVFFDWDSTALKPEALDILQTAAANAEKGAVTRLRTTGHADRSGTVAYNMGLSQRRAEAVKAELVRLGVPADEITVLWKGEADPLVQTADGVREPQNRRVEIVFE